MHLLGITWVIISMKLLYGLALDAWRWGWLDDFGRPESQVLGVLMLALVGVNVGLAFRHDEDAPSPLNQRWFCSPSEVRPAPFTAKPASPFSSSWRWP